MSERLIAGWGVRLVDRPCGCDGRGLRPGGQVCTCEAGKRLRDAAEQQGERKVFAGEVNVPLWKDGERTILGTLTVQKR